MTSEVHKKEREPAGLIEITRLLLESGSSNWVENRAKAVASVGVDIAMGDHPDELDAANTVNHLENEDMLVLWVVQPR